jgi:NAD+ synthase (glutamine-hydrolysing)
MILMAISNVENRLLLSTGNKSELAVGYCTLYGDTNGGLAVLGDVLKTEVWALARHINESSGRELIPESIINKPPSAELAPGQRDDDTLPSYHEMDPILRLYFEHKMTADEIVEKGHDRNLVDALLKRVEEPSNEFKRRQLPPALIISRHAIGPGRRRPVTQHYTKSR